MAEQMRQIGVPGTAPFTRFDLQNAEERITQVRNYIERERAKLRRLQVDSGESTGLRQLLLALERTLREFQDYRNRIENALRSTAGYTGRG
jgi:hypothetical protein